MHAALKTISYQLRPNKWLAKGLIGITIQIMAESLPTSQKAAIYDKPLDPIRIEQVKLPVPDFDDILVKILYSGVCHSGNIVYTFFEQFKNTDFRFTWVERGISCFTSVEISDYWRA